GTACGARILSLLEAPIEVTDRPDAAPAPASPRLLAFEQAGYMYPDGTEALRGLDASFRRGELVAVFGRSGSGKSTLAALATRLFDPTEGRVLLDGVDLRAFRLASLRERVGLSLQEPVLFGDSIRENLLLGRPDASDEELRAACTAAAADELVERLPEGLDTILGSAGAGLS
ncbi:MAG: ABC transporter ATP-binding protein, partial [Planctomycetes bacterium]|nr:ABC transporter ATP-binding protein [Planctomycetota bacterium]